MNGEPYCAIPQGVLVAVIQRRFSEGEHAVLLALLYRLHRFAKDAGAPQAIGFGGFAKLTGLQRRSVIRCLQSLINRRVVSVQRTAGGERNVYGVNPPEWWVGRHYSGGDDAVTSPGDRAVTTSGDLSDTSAGDRGTPTYNQGTNGHQRGSSELRSSERFQRTADDDEDGRQASLLAMHAAKAGLVDAGILDDQETERPIDFDGGDPDVDGEDEPPDFAEAPLPDESGRPDEDEAIEAEMVGAVS